MQFVFLFLLKLKWPKNKNFYDLAINLYKKHVCMFCIMAVKGFVNKWNISNTMRIIKSPKPCAKINPPVWIEHNAHVLSSHVMILRTLHVPEICIRGPKHFSGVGGHCKRLAKVVSKSRIVPPLTEKNVH